MKKAVLLLALLFTACTLEKTTGTLTDAVKACKEICGSRPIKKLETHFMDSLNCECEAK
jgi:hypothetical protein